MQGEDERFDGWKAIARHLGRDRSTVIRWAKDRGLPVHAMPGGKSRTVYAVRRELDAWMRGDGVQPAANGGSDPVEDDEARPLPLEPPSSFDPPPSGRAPGDGVARSPTARAGRWAMAAAAAILIVAPGIYLLAKERPVPDQDRQVRLDPATDARLLRARDDIASRSEPRLRAAIASLRTMDRQASGHSGIHEALAEGYLLAREFGSLPDALALEKARQEAELVLRVDGDSAVAMRVLGVVSYWRDRDVQRGGDMFRRAIAADPQDALAHQWYANILADNGDFAGAFREFAVARSLSPGAAYLLADYAWALWSAGRERQADAILLDLAARYPDLASVYDCLSVTAFARGDFAGYAKRLKTRASARGAAELISYSKLVGEAAARDDRVLYDVMLTRGLTYAEAMPASDHSWPAFVASVFGDRHQLLAILTRASERDEKWGASGYTRRIVARWKTDHAVVEAIGRLVQPPIEPRSAALRPFAT